MEVLSIAEYNRICPVCGKEFVSKNKRKIYCSKKCKGKNWRKKNSDKVREYNKKWRENNPEYYENNSKSIKEYQKNYRKKYPDKVRESNRKWRENNPDKARESRRKASKKYRENHPDKIREYDKRYYENNKKRILERKKQYYKNNKNIIAEYRKQYRQNNKDEIAEYNKQYREDNKNKLAEWNKQYKKNKINKLIKKYSEFKDIPIEKLEWVKKIPAGDRLIQTEFEYNKFGTAPEGYNRHHIIPYKTCIHYRDSFERYSDEWYYWNNLACDKNNSIDLPIEVHKMLHFKLNDNGFNKQNIIPLDKFKEYRTLTFKLIDEISRELS